MSMSEKRDVRSPKSRREFLKLSGTAVGAGLLGSLALSRGVYAAGNETLRVGLVGCVLFTVLCVWAAGRVFRVGLLAQGQPPKLGTLLRWVLRG